MFCIACGQPVENAARFCAHCGQAVRARADGPRTAFERGIEAMRGGANETAIELFRQACAASDDPAPALLMLAHVYWQMENAGAAEEHLRQVVALTPDDAYAHALLGSALLAQSRVEAAREELDLALQLAPGDFRVRVKRAEYFCRVGCHADAAQELEQALRTPAPNAEIRAYARDLLREAQARARRSFTRKPLPLIFNRQKPAASSQ